MRLELQLKQMTHHFVSTEAKCPRDFRPSEIQHRADWASPAVSSAFQSQQQEEMQDFLQIQSSLNRLVHKIRVQIPLKAFIWVCVKIKHAIVFLPEVQAHTVQERFAGEIEMTEKNAWHYFLLKPYELQLI